MGWQMEKPTPPKPKFPASLAYLWADFVRLDTMRKYDHGVRLRIEPPIIESYASLLGFAFDPWEVEAIWELDEMRVNVAPPVVTEAPEKSGVEGQDDG